MKPHDALQTELEGISSGAGEELRDVLLLAEGLRSAASRIGTPPGLQARRGAILTAATAEIAPAGRRLPRMLTLAGTLLAGAAIGWVAAFATGGLDRLGGPGPAANPSPLQSPDKRPLESMTPRPSPSPSPEASHEPSPSLDTSPDPSGIEKPDETPEPAETPDIDDTPEPDETPDYDEDNSGSGSDGDSSGSGSGSDGDSSGSGSGDNSP